MTVAVARGCIEIVHGVETITPLDPPDVQDILGNVEVTLRINKCSTASFTINNVPSAFKGVGPYTGKVGEKDEVTIWMFRDGESKGDSTKVFSGIVTKASDKGDDSAKFGIVVTCMDKGWKLQKPPALFNLRYKTPTSGKTILIAAVDCAGLDNSLVDDGSEITSTHVCDYSKPGDEVTPFTVLDEIAPKCAAGAALGFDWRITPAGAVDLFPHASISSGLTFNDDDLESFGYEKDWWRCWNSVIVYGLDAKELPDGHDAWTESDVNTSIDDNAEVNTTSLGYVQAGTGNIYTPGSSTEKLHLDRVQHYAMVDASGGGKYKITYQKEGGTETIIVTDQAVTETSWTVKEHLGVDIWSDPGKTLTVRFYFLTNNASYAIYSKWRIIEGDSFFADWMPVTSELLSTASGAGNSVRGDKSLAVDQSNGSGSMGAIIYFASPYVNGNTWPKLAFWIKRGADDLSAKGFISIYDAAMVNQYKTFDVSKEDEWINIDFTLGDKEDGEWKPSGPGFDWAQIYMIGIQLIFSSAGTGKVGHFLLDAFGFGGNRFSGSASNADSIAEWGTLCRPPETDDSLLSDAECALKAEGILATVKDPLLCVEGVKLQEGLKVGVGETVAFAVTTPSISDAALIIVEETLTLSGTNFECTLKLSNELVEIDYVLKALSEGVRLAGRKAS